MVRTSLRRLVSSALLLGIVLFILIQLGSLSRWWGQRDYDLVVEETSTSVQSAPTRGIAACTRFTTDATNHATIVLKIGAGEHATKLPRYLERLDPCKQDVLIYSDRQDTYNGIEVVDALARLRPELQANNPDFDIYYNQRQEGNITQDKTNEGWRLDKYKFLPMIERAYYERPKTQWFVFIELDTYVNYDNLYRFLAKYDPETPYYFGSPVWPKGKTVFAHGGSGFVLSRTALDKLMISGINYRGRDHRPGTHLFGVDLQAECCGDEVLAQVLKQSGVTLRGYWPMFNGEKPTTIPFDDEHWCEAIITMHHLSDDDMTDLASWETSRPRPERPLTFTELYTMIEPHIHEHVDDWHNMAEDATYEQDSPHARSFQTCRLACRSNRKCLQFTYSTGACHLGYSIRLGGQRKPQGDRMWSSGWMMDRISSLNRARPPCEGAHFLHSNP